MVNKGKGRLFKRADDKYLIYLPKDLCEDSSFPFTNLMKVAPRAKNGLSVEVQVTFHKEHNVPTLTITPSPKT